VLTLANAAKETGLTRSAIFKAIKKGTLSANKDEKGHFQIDPAELFRVYKPVNKKLSTSEQQETTKEAQETAENQELRARLDMTNQLLRQVESERDDLRRRLDEEATERRKLTALLTHQPEKKPEAARDPAKQETAKRSKKRGFLGFFRKT
jgi:hypothetical protein